MIYTKKHKGVEIIKEKIHKLFTANYNLNSEHNSYFNTSLTVSTKTETLSALYNTCTCTLDCVSVPNEVADLCSSKGFIYYQYSFDNVSIKSVTFSSHLLSYIWTIKRYFSLQMHYCLWFVPFEF